jgi:hypothetical protein
MNEREILALALDIYPILVPLTRTRRGSVSYQAVCQRLESKWHDLYPRSQHLFDALGFIVKQCRAKGLPALSALVVHKDGDKMPGGGYFTAAHPGVDDPLERQIMWAKEFELAHGTTYPPRLEDIL